MTNEINQLSNDLKDLAIEMEQSKQALAIRDVLEQLKALQAVIPEDVDANLSSTDSMDWAAANEIIEKYKYEFDVDDCISLASRLIESHVLGIKMAGVDLAAESIQRKHASESNSFGNRLRAILNEPAIEDSKEFTRVAEMLREFRNSIELKRKVYIHEGQLLPSSEVRTALKETKIAFAQREIFSWLNKHLKFIAQKYCEESDDLMNEEECHFVLDEAIAILCGEVHASASLALDNPFASIEAICYFSFGMGLKVAERADLENDGGWDLPKTFASTASSLIRNGFGENTVTFYKNHVIESLLNVDLVAVNEKWKAWVQAGKSSMDKFCRSDKKSFKADFFRHLQIL